VSTTSNLTGGPEGFDDSDNEPVLGADRLAERAHETIENAAAGAAHVEREIRRVASDAADRIRRSEGEIVDVMDENLRKVRQYVEKNPMQSAAIAFAAGVVLSSLLRR
jgi:ElaB/YqjD/DUF883 family membrane-anchored ribosome-binding protein